MGGLVGVVLACCALCWLLLYHGRRPERIREPGTARALPLDAPAEVRPRLTGAASSTRRSSAGNDIPVMAAGSADSTRDGPRRPHPIDAARLKIYRENNLIGAMNNAMDNDDYEALRRLNAEYESEYPKDENVLQEAYDIIADCEEGLTDERRARAEHFYATRRSSQLRRHVRRHCLE